MLGWFSFLRHVVMAGLAGVLRQISIRTRSVGEMTKRRNGGTPSNTKIHERNRREKFNESFPVSVLVVGLFHRRAETPEEPVAERLKITMLL